VTLPDVHLAGEAVAAYVDDALSPIARDRASRHLRWCAECHAVVEAQREAKVLLAAALDPVLPSGLVARLRDIPMTTDLGGSDIVLAIDGDQFAWARMQGSPGAPGHAQFTGHPHAAAGNGGSPAAGSTGGWSPGRWLRLGSAAVPPDAAGSRPHLSGRRGATERGGRPHSYPSRVSTGRRRRSRRIAGALAGLAFGVIASAASTGNAGTVVQDQHGGPSGNSPRLVVDRGSVSGGQPLEAGTITVPSQQRSAQLSVVDSHR
jgi:hypothetical protein